MAAVCLAFATLTTPALPVRVPGAAFVSAVVVSAKENGAAGNVALDRGEILATLETYQELPAARAYPVDSVVRAGIALEHGLTGLGAPYVYGGQSPEVGFDCSGFVWWAYQQAGVTLPRPTEEQWAVTQRIEPDDLRPGDLIFFSGTYAGGISHVGLYAGDGLMLHSAREGVGVELIPLNGDGGYWLAHLAGYGRVP